MKKTNHDGFVSIFTAIIILTVVSLVTIGFSFATRNAARRTLDDQLNTQAYYAAESGVNAAMANPAAYASNTDCNNIDISTDLDVSSSCVIVDNTPPSQKWDNVDTVIANLEFNDPLGSLMITFDDSVDALNTDARASGFSGGNAELPNQSSWGNHIGMLRLDLIPFNQKTRTDMVENMYTVFLYPSQSGRTTTTISSGQNLTGEVILVDCGSGGVGPCSIDLTLAGVGAGRTHYKARLQSMYRTVNVTSMTAESTSNAPLDFLNGQIVIDSTGRVNDVLRRIQVYSDIGGGNGYIPGGNNVATPVIGATSGLCKRLEVSPGSVTVDASNGAPSGLGEICSIN